MNTLNNWVNLSGRVLLALMFIMAGYSKIGAYEATVGYMAAYGLPGMLLPAVIALEIGAGLALVLGLFARWAALALAGFTLIAAAVFHADFSDQMQSILFMKNLAVAGGLLILAVYGAGRFSLDARRQVQAAG